MASTKISKATSAAAVTGTSDDKKTNNPQVAPANQPELKQVVEQVEMLAFDIPQTFYVDYQTFILDVAGFTSANKTASLFENLGEDHEIEVVCGDLPALDESTTAQAQPRD